MFKIIVLKLQVHAQGPQSSEQHLTTEKTPFIFLFVNQSLKYFIIFL